MFRTLLISMFLTSTALADTWTVDDDGKADFDNIQAAIDAASDGDEIIVMPGTYTGPGDQVVNMSGKAIWLHSLDGPALTIIDGEDTRQCLVCVTDEDNQTIIEGLQFTRGYSIEGAGIYINGASPTVLDCKFVENNASFAGGGLACDGGFNEDIASISNCTFSGNSALLGAGLFCQNNSPNIHNCIFASNNVTTNGGGIYTLNSSSTITKCAFTTNSAENGGGVACYGGTPLLTNCIFVSNNSTDWGGGIYIYEATPIMQGCTFMGNAAEYGGGAFCTDPAVDSDTSVFISCNFINNITLSEGGGLYAWTSSDPILTDCTFTGNSATGGGGIYSNASQPTLTRCSFISNDSTLFGGGGMYCDNSDATLTDCTFQNQHHDSFSSVYNHGAGLRCYGSSPTLDGCTFISNTTDYYGYGGGLYCSQSSNPSLTNCIFDDNKAYGNNGGGGGVFSTGNSSLSFQNCQFLNNEVYGSFTINKGGGIYCIEGNVSFNSCTFSNNYSTSSGAGGAFWNATLSFDNCIFQGNESNTNGGGIYISNCLTIFEGCHWNSNIAWYGGGASISGGLATLENCTMKGNLATNYSGIFGYGASIACVDINTLNTVGMEYPGAQISFSTNDACDVNGDVTPSADGSTLFDIDDLETDAVLAVNGELYCQGGLAITNNSGTLMASNVGDIVPLANASSIPSNFDSFVFPSMPEGLGLQLIEYPAFQGINTEIALEVISVENAQFADPYTGDLNGSPIDIIEFDADGDGLHEIAILFSGTPGNVVAFHMSKAGIPTPIQGLEVAVGNNPVSIDAADLNGDGFEDLLVANSTDASISVILTMNDSSDDSLYFDASTLYVAAPNQSITCVSAMDWNNNVELDVVVGIDVEDEELKDGYQVMIDVASDSPVLGTLFEIEMYDIIEDGIAAVADPPTCAHGGNNASAWGFIGGTRYGRVLRATPSGTWLTVDELEGNNVVTIEALELDANGGDDQLDLMVSSDEAETIYLFQGGTGGGFGELIPVPVSLPVLDVIAIDADDDGDKDIVMTAPTTETPLVLLRNDGDGNGLVGTLEGLAWSKQIINNVNPPNKIASGNLDDKSEDDDWIVGAGGGPGLLGEPTGTLEQSNILLGPQCDADVSGDGDVNVTDLLVVIDQWGLSDSPADVNADGIVDVSDLLMVVGNWGPCE